MIKFMLNGKETEYTEEKIISLVEVLRGNFGLFGVKEGYKNADCEIFENASDISNY